jgi:hypothetical protein
MSAACAKGADRSAAATQTPARNFFISIALEAFNHSLNLTLNHTERVETMAKISAVSMLGTTFLYGMSTRRPPIIPAHPFGRPI